MIKLIFYDLDGTLVDTRKDIALSANAMREQMGLPLLDHAEITSYVGRGVHHLISGCLKTDDIKTIEKGIKLYRGHYSKHMMDHSRLYDGAQAMLEFYKDRRQVVLTNKPNPFSRDMLTQLGVAGYFEEILAGDSEYAKKPDPAAVFAMMTRFSVSAQETLFVGDSLVDIETARNAGVRIAVLTHGFSTKSELQSASPDTIKDHFSELLEWMKKNDN